MNVAVTFVLTDGTALTMKKLGEAPHVGDEVEIGKTTTPRLYVVTKRRFRDSNDDYTRIDATVREIKQTKGAKKR